MATKLHTFIPRSKHQTSDGHAYQYKQRNDKTVHACIPRSKRQTINGDAYSNARRQKTNLHAYVYLVLSVRQAMEALVNSSRRKTKLSCACIPRSKRQTSNGDAYKCKQTEKRLHVHVDLVLSMRRTMKTLVNSSRRKTKLHVHVYLVLSGKSATSARSEKSIM